MLESIVSVLPSDWFSLVVGPRPLAYGKEGLYPRGVCVLCVTFIPTVKLSMVNHYEYIKENK